MYGGTGHPGPCVTTEPLAKVSSVVVSIQGSNPGELWLGSGFHEVNLVTFASLTQSHTTPIHVSKPNLRCACTIHLLCHKTLPSLRLYPQAQPAHT